MNEPVMEHQHQEAGPGADGEMLEAARESPLLECPACRRVVGELGVWKVVPGYWLRVSSRMGLCPRHGEGGGTG